MKPSGAHTHPELRGSGGGNGWLIVLGAVVLAAIAGPAAHAISHLIQVLAITLAAVLAIASLAAILTCWVRHKNTRPLTQRAVSASPGGTPPLPRGECRGRSRHHRPPGRDLGPARQHP